MNDDVKYYTYKLDMMKLNILAIFIFLIVSVSVFLIERGSYYEIVNNWWLVVLLVLYMILHEVLHGVGFLINKEVKRENVVYGMYLEKGVFYCMCKQVIGKRTILISLMFPLVFIGIVTLIWGMFIDSYLLVFLSICNITGAVGDIVMIWYFLGVGDVKYLDLDDCTSFTVLSRNDLLNYKIWGINLVDSGIYNEKMSAKDRGKIRISKASLIIMVIVLVITVGYLIK